MYQQTPEGDARLIIDDKLKAAGWVIQDLKALNLYEGRGVAVREVQSSGGPADYLLFVGGKALGVVEAKKAGTTLSAVSEQSARYGKAKEFIPQRWADPLPFRYESNEGVPLAVAKRVFGEDPKAIIEELNATLIAS